MAKINLEDLDFDFEEEEEEEVVEEVEEVEEVVEEEEEVEEEVEEVVEEEEAVSDDEMPDLSEFLDSVDKKVGKKKGTKKNTPAPTPSPKPKEPYKGPRIIKVYGNELWIEKDPKVTEEDIRKRIVKDFNYEEFRKDATVFDLDEETGILDIGKKFQKKG